MPSEPQIPLAGGLQPPASLSGLTAPVWGVDPSTLRMSFAAVIPYTGHPQLASGRPAVEWSTVSLPRKVEPLSAWFGLAFQWTCDHVRELRAEWGEPALVLVEEPFAGGQARVHPSSNRMLGVLLAALGYMLPRCDVQLVHPNVWKKEGLGAGRGAAKPAEYLAWAREIAGYTGDLEDEAAAIGIATAAGVRLMERRA